MKAIATTDYLPLARVLMESVSDFHQGVARYLLLVDPVPGHDTGIPDCTVAHGEDLVHEAEELRRPRHIDDVVEFSCRFTALLAEHLPQSQLPGQGRLDAAVRSGLAEGLRYAWEVDQERVRRLGLTGVWRKLRRRAVQRATAG